MAIKAKLTTFDTTMIVVSLVIGIGIFRVPAMVSAATGRPLLFFLAWGLGGLVSLFGALTFAEIGSRFSKPGGYYQVVAENYHSSFAFILNWASVLVVNGAGAAAVATIGAEYLTPILLPSRLQNPLAVQLTAAGLVLFLFVINFLGIKTGAWAQNALSMLKVGMILTIVAAAVLSQGRAEPSGPTASPLPSGAVFPQAWWIALALGFIPVFYTYGGYQCTINFGADVKDARRNMPRAIIAGIVIIIACYILINIAYVRVLGFSAVAGAKLVAAEVARAVFGRAGHLITSLVISLSAMGFLNATLMQIPRVYYAMAEDRSLPRLFMQVNARTQTQEFGLSFLVANILLSIFLLGTFETMVNSVMFIDSLNIAAVASTVFLLRRKNYPGPDYAGYRVPLYPVLSAVFVIFLLSISVNVLLRETRTALIGAAISLTGFPVFYLMRRFRKPSSDKP